MPLTQEDYIAPSSEAPPESGHGMRPEDVLRLALTVGVLLVVGLVLGSFTFRELEGRGTGYFIIVLCLAVIMTSLAYFKFELALALFVGAIWLNFGGTPDLAKGVSSGTGKALYPVELGAMFLTLIWILRGLGRGKWGIVRTPMNVPLLAYLAFSVWTAVNGNLFWDPALTRFYAGMPGEGRTAPQVTIVELGLRTLSIGMFWLVAGSLGDPKWLRRVTWLLFLPGALICLSYYHVLPSLSGGWPALLEIAPACTLWAWLLQGENRSPRLRALGWLALGLLVFQIFLLGNAISWISGWFALFAGLFFIAFLKSKRLFAGLIAVSMILVVAAIPFLKSHVVHDVQTSGDLDRFSMMRGAVMYAMHFPLGVGPGNYRAYNLYYGRPSVWNTTAYTSAHDFYAQSLSEMGFVGLLITLVWVVGGVVMLTRLYRRCPPGFSRTVILGVAGTWAGLCAASIIGDYMIPVYHNGGLITMTTTIYSWIGLGIATAHARQQGLLSAAAASTPAPDTPEPPLSAAQFYPRRLS